MLDLFAPLKTSFKSIASGMADWFAMCPSDLLWTVVSVYCIDDPGKKNDVISLVIISSHDTLAKRGLHTSLILSLTSILCPGSRRGIFMPLRTGG